MAFIRGHFLLVHGGLSINNSSLPAFDPKVQLMAGRYRACISATYLLIAAAAEASAKDIARPVHF